VEGDVKRLGNFPETPPPALFEAIHLLEAATAFWGLDEGDIVLRSRRADICWPRYVCVFFLKAKGMTLQSIGKFLDNRDPSSISNALKQYKDLTETFPAYQRQVVEFDRYCWNSFKGLPTKRYKTEVARP
jgi:chromosomal replication initiation ATPase DnaA